MDYKLRLCFIRLDPFFKGGQLVVPFLQWLWWMHAILAQLHWSSSFETNQPQFLSELPFVPSLATGFHHFGLWATPIEWSPQDAPVQLWTEEDGLFDHLSGLFNLILSIKKSAIGSINSISNPYLPCLQGLQVWRYHLGSFLCLQVSFLHLSHEMFKLFIYQGIQVRAVEATPLTHVPLELLHQKLQCSSLGIPFEILDTLNITRADHLQSCKWSGRATKNQGNWLFQALIKTVNHLRHKFLLSFNYSWWARNPWRQNFHRFHCHNSGGSGRNISRRRTRNH